YRMFTYVPEETTASHQRPACLRPPPRKKQLRMVRPSLIDPRFTGDPWIVEGEDGSFALYLGDYCLAGIHGLTIDLPSFNQVFERLRTRRLPTRLCSKG